MGLLREKNVEVLNFCFFSYVSEFDCTENYYTRYVGIYLERNRSFI